MSTRAQLYRQRVAELSRHFRGGREKEIAKKPGWEDGWKGCPSGKFGHYTRAQAREHAYSLRKKEPLDERELDVYPCSQCGRWHVGHARIEVV